MYIHQGLGYPLPAVEVRVKIEYVHESKDLWELVVGYVKRNPLILDDFVYPLERSGSCHFVTACGRWRVSSGSITMAYKKVRSTRYSWASSINCARSWKR